MSACKTMKDRCCHRNRWHLPLKNQEEQQEIYYTKSKRFANPLLVYPLIISFPVEWNHL